MKTPLNQPMSAQLNEDEKLMRSVRLSFLFHGAFILIAVLKQIVFPSAIIPIPPSLRVDLIGLPDFVKAEQNKWQPTPAQEQEPEKKPEIAAPVEAPTKKEVALPTEKEALAAKEEMVLNPKPSSTAERKQKMKSALSRIKALTRINREADTDNANAAPVLLKGNVLSSGESSTGAVNENAQMGYFERVRERLQENWELPVWLSRQNYSAQVQIHIDPRGQLRSFQFTKSSGNPQFDDEVKKAIKNSVPYPLPPTGLATAVLTNGILVGFPL